MTQDSHPRIFLLVVDDTPELQVALRYTCRRTRAIGARVALLSVIEPADTEWLGVGDIMRAERRVEAEQKMQEFAAQVQELSGSVPVIYIREGEIRDELLMLLDEDPTISVLVLGVNVGPGGPGPLITALTGKFAAHLHIPLTLVPGSLTQAEVDKIT